MLRKSCVLLLYFIISFSIVSIEASDQNKSVTNIDPKNKFDTKFIDFADNKTNESVGPKSAFNNQYIVAMNNSNNNGYIVTAPKEDLSQRRDPLVGLQQNANPFLAGAPGIRNQARKPENDIDPRLALILQNSPRLQLLARQNPILAQRILRNPALLQDPRVAAVIRSQLTRQGGGGLGLLPGLGSFLPGGALSPLTPLGIGLGAQRRGLGGLGGLGANQNSGLPRGGGERNDNSGFGGGQRGFGIGLPVQNPRHRNEENIGGGYYGNNGNYGQNNRNVNQNDNKNNEVNTDDNESENNQDQNEANNEEDENENQSGQEGDGQEEGGEDQSQDQNQNPAEDPDIKQLQELGGSGDNFPEGLFPPGLLSKEDIAEIRKQQEKQAKEQAEKEKQQQQGGDNQGQDYDYNNNDNNEGEGGDEEAAEEGNAEENAENENAKQEEPQNPITTQGYIPQVIPTPPPVHKPQSNQQHNTGRNVAHRNNYSPSDFGGQKQPSVPNPGVQYDDVVEGPVLNQPKNKNNKNNYVNIKKPKVIPTVQYQPQGYQIPVNPRHQYVNNQPQQVNGYQQSQNPQQHQYQQQPQQQFYPQQQHNPQQFVPQQQYIPQQHPQQQHYQPQPPYNQQNPQQYPQQFIDQQYPNQQQYHNQQQYPNQQQYLNQQQFPNQQQQQHYQNQANAYQQYPVQQYPQQQQQHQHLQPQPVYPSYQSQQPITPSSTPIQTRRQIYTNVVNQHQFITPPPQPHYTTPDPNIANHNLNAVAENDEEPEYNDNTADEENEDESQDGEEGDGDANTTGLPNFANNGQTFQQHPRIFSPVYTATASTQTLPLISGNATNQTVSSQNVKRSLKKQ